MEVKLLKPFNLDGQDVKVINLGLEDLTGSDILRIDLELKEEGHVNGFTNVYDQKVLLKMASKSSGIHTEDLERLPAADFLEVTFTVRNFLLGLLGQTEEQAPSEESSSN